MLSGEKPVCILEYPFEREQIQTLMNAVRHGKLSMMTDEKSVQDQHGNGFVSYYFCQAGKEDDMKQLVDLIESDKSFSNIEEWFQYTDKVGRFLGYSEDDLDIFRKWNTSSALEAYQWYAAQKNKWFPPSANADEPEFDFSPMVFPKNEP